MKQVSFKVAKALKAAGYPQDENEELKMRGLPEKIDMPTYIAVWLWLCDKGIVFYPTMYSAHEPSGYSCYYRDNVRVLDYDNFGIHSDPEEAIIAAIDYLVENNLIK